MAGTVAGTVDGTVGGTVGGTVALDVSRVSPIVVTGAIVVSGGIVAIVAIYALEVLVAFIQAYVFTILTCVYLKDALHPGH